ncbi:type 2 lanthipeptide synthetase LanM [Paenibacillus sp. IHBB 10380]|uniref:type 2 lanthipeptide synthetase LanM n=1 Tax=Paenibacillus sp. IHBB 10380 TaxID=1566358 RepID=UPI000AF9C03B|nr:type 2 lanthipeptide synthetase LanM [Paenibacillus sp. IHBB 10380]
MNKIIEKARKIDENKKGYSDHSNIDYTYLKEWRNVRTLLNDKYFEIMLKETSFTKEEFAYSLQPIDNSNGHKEDVWFDDFIEMLNEFDYEDINYQAGVQVPILPFNRHLLQHLQQVIHQLNEVEVGQEVIKAFLEAHCIEMFNVMGKIIALKLEEYKQTNSFLSEDKEIRFQEFLKATLYSKESYLKLYEEYPVAARVATIRTMYLKKNFTDILQRIEKDSFEIRQFLELDKLNLTEINLSTGDSHEQGKSVSILSFGDKKLVYKPKNLEISMAFEKFIDWYTRDSELLPIKIPKGIYRTHYAFNEFVIPHYCKSEIEVENFYLRYGYLNALCYLLSMNDLHLENIIADGGHPVIVDIETIFQTSLNLENESIYSDLMKHLEVDSVSNSCLLPRQISMGLGEKIELSALNGKEVKLSQKYLSPAEVNTDEFHYEKIEGGYFAGGNNIPKFDETEEINFQKYSLKILEGFNDFMKFVLENKAECLEELNIFQGYKIRSLLKGTERYASMIRYSNHPNYNREMNCRERLMMNIWAYPYLDKRIIKSEVRDLLFNDIPIFYSITDSRDLIDSQQNIYPNFHQQSGFEISKHRISGLTEKEIIRQRSILLSSLGITDFYLNQEKQERALNYPVQKIDYLKQAKLIADRLIDEAFENNEECSFVNVDCNDKKQWKMIPCDESLYGGLSGISILFLELYIKTNEEIYLTYYRKLIHTAVEQAKRHRFQSAFTGWLSPIFPIALEYRLLGTVSERSFLELTLEKLESLETDDIEKIKGTDYISGISGILRLISVIRLTFGIESLSENTVQKFVNVLIQRISLGEDKSIGVIGIAHGISGLALGLASLEIMDSEYISSLLSKEFELDIPVTNIKKWCWGLPGMIQARLELMKICPTIVDKKQLATLIEQFDKSLTTMRNDDTLCHGSGSVITTLKMLYEYTQEEKWVEFIQIWISNMNMNALFEGYTVPKILETNAKGIFDGISGVGWIYLYISGSVSNLLLLESKL